MASSSPEPGSGIFAQLSQKNDSKAQQTESEAAAAIEKQFYEAQSEHTSKLLDNNSSLPVTVGQVRVNGAYHTRPGFLARALSPLLVRDRQWTLQELIKEVYIGSEHLNRFDIFHEPISIFLDRPDQTAAGTSPTDLDVHYTAFEKNRLTLQSGTEVGNAEGNAYANAQWRNIFGGAESAGVSATFGTRTRSAYSSFFRMPINANPNLWLEAAGSLSTVDKPWASHEQVSRTGHTLVRYLTKSGHNHEFKYGWDWRTLAGLADDASPSVRHEAGHSVKSSISHTWSVDRRDRPSLATRGAFARLQNEVAGIGALGGDVAFWRSETEGQLALPLGPYLQPRGWSLTLGGRAGMLYPLALGNSGKVRPSRLPDRFQLGGATDVRGFRISGLGPRDGADALGGDVFAAASANLLFPLPRVKPENPLRGQLFLTAGRLLALAGDNDPIHGLAARDVPSNVSKALSRLASETPSVTAGVGLVYAHPIARFELNFSLPLIVRKGEQSRKGLSFGVGINML